VSDPEITAEESSRRIGLSRSQRHRKLDALTGQSATEFIRSIRLLRAASLMKQGYGNISACRHSRCTGHTPVTKILHKLTQMLPEFNAIAISHVYILEYQNDKSTLFKGQRIIKVNWIFSALWIGLQSLASLAPANPVKNVILMISDGCGYNHIEATDYFEVGVNGKQIYQQFPVQYAVSTYSLGGEYNPELAWRDFKYVEQKPTDSAAASTAISTGVKISNGAICFDATQTKLLNLVERFEAIGRTTGVITTVPFSHATPAGMVAHNGQGKQPGMEWHSGQHTNQLIPLFALGAGSEKFHPLADQVDAVRGKYIDNTEIARVIIEYIYSARDCKSLASRTKRSLRTQ
jgi:AraC-like DNA-binding protein